MTGGGGPRGHRTPGPAQTDRDAGAHDADPATARLLAALLRIDPSVAAGIRAAAARARPRPQTGPAAEYGD